MRDAWKRHAAITLRGDDALGLGEALAAWRDELAADPAGAAGNSAAEPDDEPSA